MPETVVDALTRLQSGLRGARWRPRENLHLTLRFIGDADGAGFQDIADRLARVDVPGFDLSLSGCGSFGDRKPRAVLALAKRDDALVFLQKKIENAVQQAGFAPESRKFTPHITLAYLKGARQADVQEYLAINTMFAAGPFPVSEFHLYSSILGETRSTYRTEESYSLSSSK